MTGSLTRRVADNASALLHMSLLVIALVTLAATARGGDVLENHDLKTGWTVVTARQGEMVVRMVPEAGANIYSIQYRGIQLLKTPKSLADLRGYMYGVPVIYPMPNRVRDGKFTFAGKEYNFTPNNDGNFLHGLVHSVPWKHKFSSNPTSATIEAWYDFAPGTEALKLFPHPHTIRLTVTVTNDAVKFAYEVDNSQGKTAVPYGLALHPWFIYQGSRSDTYLTVPATHLMEAIKLLPTGKLVDLDGSLYDLRQPKSLAGFVIDDVYYGMQPDKPALIDFRDRKLKIALKAGREFTHMVVYTPENERWFCVENQTCSTDAHNLFAKGLSKESHLLVVPPGQRSGSSATFSVDAY